MDPHRPPAAAARRARVALPLLLALIVAAAGYGAWWLFLRTTVWEAAREGSLVGLTLAQVGGYRGAAPDRGGPSRPGWTHTYSKSVWIDMADVAAVRVGPSGRVEACALYRRDDTFWELKAAWPRTAAR